MLSLLKMKQLLFIFSLMLLASSNAAARRCLEGAVFDEDGKAQLVDCAKWERNPEAVLTEQDAINAYSSEDLGDFTVERTQSDETPALGKAQNKINDTWHNVYKSIFN